MKAASSENLASAPVRYPFEYFAAQLVFADKLAELVAISLWDALEIYTPLREEVIGATGSVLLDTDLWHQFTHSHAGLPLPQIAEDLYALYLHQPHAIFQADWAPKGTTRFGALGIDASAYNRERNQVKLHFLPTRRAGSDLGSQHIAERRADMTRLLQFVKTTHPHIGFFTSYSWLQNLPTYQALFPPSFLERRVEMRDRFLGLWGQFVRWDGSANHHRYRQFLHALTNAATVDQAIDAIPLQVLGAVGPLEEFYDWYQIP